MGIVGGALALLTVPLIILFFRYELTIGGADPVTYRFDRWNGTANLCLPNQTNPLELNCSGRLTDFTTTPTK